MFITLEGLDGSGKTSLGVALATRLSEAGVPVTTTLAPGGTPTGLLFRELLLGVDDPITLQPMTTLLLFLADRVEHCVAIRDALGKGYTVLCDRFSDSTIAYQGAMGFGRPMLDALDEMVCAGLRPALTLLLDASPFELEMRKGKDDRFEREQLDFHVKVRANYKALVADCPDRFIVLDATKDQGELLDEAFAAVMTHRAKVLAS